MRGRWLGFCLLGAMLPQAARAEVLAGADLAKRLPVALIRQMQTAPDDFAARLGDVILTYGGEEGLTAAGIETWIGAERARVRAREAARYLRVDLDGNNQISRAELEVLLRLLPEGSRGKAEVNWRLADKDGNAVLDMAELTAFAQARAVEVLTEVEAAAMRDDMNLDLNGDGKLQLSEVTEALVLVRALPEAVAENEN